MSHHVEHSLHVGAILTTDLQPVVVLIRFGAQPEWPQTTAELAQQGMSLSGSRFG
jgi:hypothetical protein